METKKIFAVLFVIFLVLITTQVVAAGGNGNQNDSGSGNSEEAQPQNQNQTQNQTQEQKQEQSQNGTCNGSGEQTQNQEQNQNGTCNGSGEQNQEQNQNGTCNGTSSQNQKQNQNGTCNGTGDQNQEQNQNGTCNGTGNQNQEQNQNGTCNGTGDQNQERNQEQNQNGSSEDNMKQQTQNQEQNREQNQESISEEDGANQTQNRVRNQEQNKEGPSNNDETNNNNNNGYRWRNQNRYQIEQGIQNGTVVQECNISMKEGKTYLNSYSYQKGMMVELEEQNKNRLQIRVSAEFKEGKVLVLNVEKNAFQVKNSEQLRIKFDGQEIKITDVKDVIDGQGSEAKYAVAIGEDGGQYLIYIPHFSEHVITLEILDLTEEEVTNYLLAAFGAGILTILIFILIVVRIGKFRE